MNHTLARFNRATQFAENALRANGVKAEDLEKLLGDHSQLESGKQVMGGNIISNPMTVQSIVVEPEKRQLRLAVGQTPIGTRHYVTIPWQWSDTPGVSSISCDKPDAEQSSWEQALGHYTSACRNDLEFADPGQAESEFRSAAHILPDDPAIQFLSGAVALRSGNFEHASDCFDAAASCQQDVERLNQAAEWRDATLTASGKVTSSNRKIQSLAGKIKKHHRNTCIDYMLVDASI